VGFADTCHNFASGLGKFVGAGHNALAWPGKTLRKLLPQSSREKIRSIVTEELTLLIAEQTKLTGAELQEHLQVMAEAIESLQEKIAELSAHGPISQADVFKAMGSLKAAASLNDDERAILANIFRQNIAIQKPELIDTAVERDSLRVISR